MLRFKSAIFFSLLLISTSLIAQQNFNEESKRGFKKENIFLGSGLNLAFASRSFNIGVNPEIGYSITHWLDAGITLNINYFSQNATEFSNIRYRNFNYGGGPFIRLWPVNFLFIQAQPEYNFTSSSQKDVINNVTGTYQSQASSFLVGLGYGTKLMGSHYSYFSLMIDVLQNYNSPYRDQYNDPLPIFRAGFGFYLKPRRQ